MTTQQENLDRLAREYVADTFGEGQCERCAHYRGGGTCEAFPEAIPLEIILEVHDHREPFEGDGGVTFEAK